MTLQCLPANDCGTFLSADLSRCKFAFGCKINHFLHKCAQLEAKVLRLIYIFARTQYWGDAWGTELWNSPQTSQPSPQPCKTSHNGPSVRAKCLILHIHTKNPQPDKIPPDWQPRVFYIYMCLWPALIFGCSEAGGEQASPTGLCLEKDLLPSPRIMSSASCVGEHLLNPGCLMLNCQ